MVKKKISFHLKFALSALIMVGACNTVLADGMKLREKKVIDEARREKIRQKISDYKNKPASLREDAIPDPRLEGWWLRLTRGTNSGFGFGSRTEDIDTYINIDFSEYDSEDNPFIIVNTLCGTPTYPRECTPLDVRPPGITDNVYYVPTSTSLVQIFDVNGPAFDPENGQSFWSLQLQSDGVTLLVSDESDPSWVGYNPTGAGMYRKVDAPIQPVRPYDDTAAGFPSVTDPVEIAKYIRNAWLLNENQAQNVNLNDTDYLPYADAEAIFQKMLNEGITYTSKIRRIRVSRTGEHTLQEYGEGFVSTDVLTDIFTEGFSHALTGSTVKISGFTGKWKKLNGTYVNGVAIAEDAGVPNPSPDHLDTSSSHIPHHGTFRNVYNHFLLDFDSSDEKKFPRSHEGWAKDIEGDPIVTVTHRFTPDMQYPAFFAAVRSLFFSIYQVSQHSSMAAYFRPGSMFLIDTWDDLQAAVAVNDYWSSPDHPGDSGLRTRTPQAVPSGFYNNVTRLQRGAVTYNDPFGLSQVPGSFYDYNIVLANYIVDPKNLYWAIAGTPDLTPVTPNGEPLQFDPVDIDYNPAIPGSQRAEFVGALGDIIVDDGTPVPQNPDPTYYYQMTNGLGDEVQDSNSYYFGMIDPCLTKDKKVGYLRWQDEELSDFLSIMPTTTFAPDVPVTAKYAREAVSKVYASMMRYFQTDQDCDAIILDIRSNNGGFIFPGVCLAEFFGDDRIDQTNVFTRKDNGTSPLIDFSDSMEFDFYANNVQVINDSFAQFFVQQNEDFYGPGVVFRGTAERPKKVIILTDNAATSSGDVFPHYWMGDNLDGDIGSYTTCKILGDIDARLKGTSSSYSPVPLSEFANFLYGQNGLPISPIRLRVDSGDFGEQLNPDGTFFNQQLSQIAPSFAPSLSGTAGGAPLPNDWHNTVWPDIGLIKPPKGHFSKHIHRKKPKFHHRSTWRDSWLEQAILAACE